uniref:Uncharacterized protein n=1 Tax=Anguilla anguilla TaxID=7936 RepID=A0A0E9QWY1_ANGAN
MNVLVSQDCSSLAFGIYWSFTLALFGFQCPCCCINFSLYL